MQAAVKNIKPVQRKPTQANQPFFQPKLKLGAANDSYEREADATALTVVEGGKANGANSGAPTGQRFFTPTINRKSLQEDKEGADVMFKREGEETGEVSSSFENRMNTTNAGGQPLPKETQTEMERGFGADFSGVKIHTGSASARLNQEVGARAFTQGNNIHFNQGQFQPNSKPGKLLLAHELTHTIQQGASAQNEQTVQRAPKAIQRGLFSRAWGAVKGAASKAANWAKDKIKEGITWLKEKAKAFVAHVPGYFAMTVILGKDPVTNKEVPRTATNFIRAGVTLIPGGQLLWDRLQKYQILQEASTYLDQRVKKFNLNLPGVVSELAAIWRGLGLSDIRNPKAVLERVGNVFLSRIEKVVQFGIDVGSYFLNLLKKVVLKLLAEHIKGKSKFYPMLQLTLGYDPVTDEKVDRTPKAIIRAIAMLTPEGEEVYKQLESSGALDKALDYANSLMARVATLIATVKANIMKLWGLASVESILNPLDFFKQLFGIFIQIATAVFSFVASVVKDFLQFVKDALTSYLRKYASKFPGYDLMAVILGRDPITQTKVLRTPKNLIKGFFGLIPGGQAQFKQLNEAGAIDKALDWIIGAIKKLGLVFSAIKNAIFKLWNDLSWSDLKDPVKAFKRIINTILKPIKAVVDFVGHVVVKIVSILFELMSMPASFLKRILAKVKLAIGLIAKNPIGFVKNLLRALKLGFVNFFENIGKHLKKGLSTWLFGQLGDAGIEIPKDFTFKSIIKMVFQILGITVENIWKRIKKKLTPSQLAKLEKMKDRLGGVWGFITDMIKKGPAGIWKSIKEKIKNLWNTVFKSIKNWIVTKIITEVTIRIAIMLNPAGAIVAVINGFIALFKLVQTLMEKIKAMLQILGTVADSIVEIAKGSITKAAEFIEKALGQALPIAIAFLANQLGLGGLSKKLKEMIGKVQAKVNKALDWLIAKALKFGKSIFKALKAGVKSVGSRVKNWWKALRKFRTKDGSNHKLYFKGTGKNAKLTIASSPTKFEVYINGLINGKQIKQTEGDKALVVAKDLDKQRTKSVAKGKEAAHNEKINALMDNLATIVAELPLTQSKKNTAVVFGPLHKEFGTFASVRYRKPPFTKGSSPSVSNGEIYTALNVRKKGGGSFYVKGHLLNENLGGPGNTWNNLTPLSQQGNSNHKTGFENEVKQAVNNSKGNEVDTMNIKAPGEMMAFKVTPKYGRTLPPIYNDLDSDKLNKVKGDKIPTVKEMQDLLKAELNVPTALMCSARYKGNKAATETVFSNKAIPNPIDYGNIPKYQLTEAKKPVFNFGEKLNAVDVSGLSVADANLKKEQFLTNALAGVNKKMARKIMKTVRDGLQGKQYSTAIGISKSELEQQNDKLTFVFSSK